MRVQFREDDDVVSYVATTLGLNPNDVAKRAFEAEVRRLRASRRRAKIASLDLKPVKGGYARLVREDRDAH
jgi:kynureninase